jgi:hypothetical protein
MRKKTRLREKGVMRKNKNNWEREVMVVERRVKNSIEKLKGRRR